MTVKRARRSDSVETESPQRRKQVKSESTNHLQPFPVSQRISQAKNQSGEKDLDSFQIEEAPSSETGHGDLSSSESLNTVENESSSTSSGCHDDIIEDTSSSGESSSISIQGGVPSFDSETNFCVDDQRSGAASNNTPDLQARILSFLPELQKANLSLEASEIAKLKRIDEVDDSVEDYIEMNLGLGVLTEKEPRPDGIVSTRMSSTSESDTSGESDRSARDPPSPSRLLAGSYVQKPKPSIREIGDT